MEAKSKVDPTFIEALVYLQPHSDIHCEKIPG